MDLRFALIVIGLVIIAAVVFNAIDKLRLIRRSLRSKQDREVRFSGNAGIPATPDAPNPAPGRRYQPDINPPPLGELKKKILKPAETPARIEPVISSFTDELASLEQTAAVTLDLGVAEKKKDGRVSTPNGHRFLPDERIDFIINLPGAGPVTRDTALGVYRQNEYVLEKPRHLCGLRYSGGSWSDLENDPPSTEYSDLSLAIQLTDDKGPIDESELNNFVQMGLKLADALKRPTRLSLPLEEAVSRARELGEFCEKYDVIAGINVVANNEEGFSGKDIDEVVTAQGMEFGAMDIYHMKQDDIVGCRHLFSLANLFQPGRFTRDNMDTFRTKGLALFMSVACAHDPARAFDRMAETAENLCRALNGSMQDQERRPLDREGLSVIRTQIGRMASEMKAQGIMPGSETALRIF